MREEWWGEMNARTRLDQLQLVTMFLDTRSLFRSTKYSQRLFEGNVLQCATIEGIQVPKTFN